MGVGALVDVTVGVSAGMASLRSVDGEPAGVVWFEELESSRTAESVYEASVSGERHDCAEEYQSLYSR